MKKHHTNYTTTTNRLFLLVLQCILLSVFLFQNNGTNRYHVNAQDQVAPLACADCDGANGSRCESIDYRTMDKVYKVCSEQCPKFAGCVPSDNDAVVTTPIPTSAPIVVVPGESPVTGPVSSPSAPQSGSPVPPPPGDSPVTAPQPTTPVAPPQGGSPVTAPIFFPPPVATPVSIGIPVLAPVLAPVPPPFSIPSSNNFDPFPNGPYITTEKSSQRVIIPRPPVPMTVSTSNLNCPHLGNDLKNWNDPTTWGGIVPNTNGSPITIPVNTKVVITQSIMNVLGIVTIPVSSELIVGTNPVGIDITARGFIVNGKFHIGSETCTIDTPVTITLEGPRPNNTPTVTIAPPEYKGIHVHGVGSLLSFHGQRFYHTWTRLALKVVPGERVIMLQEKVNWMVGQEIVLVTSTMKDSRDYNQNEVLTIRAIDTSPSVGVGAIVYVEEVIKFQHIANQYYQVEVGLLSRSILIQGDDQSEPTDPDPLNCVDKDAGNKWTIYFNNTQPCVDKELTGYGGHIMISDNGIGQVEGVELYRMGQTNVKARYPMHFHLLDSCPSCYFKSSSIHRSYYRCISIHGSHNTTTSENVAFDVIGYCYYLEDGVELDNMISYNLAAHIHTIGPDFVRINGHTTLTYYESSILTLPADITASGFYVTNIHNNFIGNAASGGWSGFAFPSLPTPLGTFRSMNYRPANADSLTFDGNTAHSSAWWWRDAGAFYIGGALYYDQNDKLVYDPGTSDEARRTTCQVNNCVVFKSCTKCDDNVTTALKMTNSKAFLAAGMALNSWQGMIEVQGFEAHDVRLVLQAISSAFWMDNMLAVCRTGENLGLPTPTAQYLAGSGLIWYDTNQKHIISNSVFRNCGYRSDAYNQYDTSPTRGCGDNSDKTKGCETSSSVFGFETHSDEFTPELMQATGNITLDNCGRRFRFVAAVDKSNTVSGRHQNWFDADGSVTGLGEPSYIGPGIDSVKDWWGVDDAVVYEPQAPLRFIKKNDGPERGLAFTQIDWDITRQALAANSLCTSMMAKPCPPEGYFRHAGWKFSPFKNPTTVNAGNPLTVNGDMVGPAGGYGWILTFNNSKSPRRISFDRIEVDPTTPLLISIPYPPGTQFNITAHAPLCFSRNTSQYTCLEIFTPTNSITSVRTGAGNTFHVDSNGVLTFRLGQIARRYTGNPLFSLPDYSTPPREARDLYSLKRFERAGVRLPWGDMFNKLIVQAVCPTDTSSSPTTTGYCEPVTTTYDPDVCPAGYAQTSYDKCCQKTDPTKCRYSNGAQNF